MAVYPGGIPVPSFDGDVNDYTGREILAGDHPKPKKRGITLKGGQGILLAGTVLAQKSSDKLYYVYNNGGSGGLEVATGVLAYTVDTGASAAVNFGANQYKGGCFKTTLLSGMDSAALVDLNGTTAADFGQTTLNG